MGKFDKYKGLYPLMIDGVEYQVKFTVLEKGEILNICNEDSKFGNKMIKLASYMKPIMVRHFADEPKESVEAMVEEEIQALFMELPIAFGLMEREQLENIIESKFEDKKKA